MICLSVLNNAARNLQLLVPLIMESFMFGRLEKVNLRSIHSKVKILGTLLCVLGALTMSIMQSISAPATKNGPMLQLSSTPSDFIFDKQKIMGCFYLMTAIFILSSNVVLQVTCNQIRKRTQSLL